MLWRTEASLRQVSSAMSSTLSNLGGFIFWRSSLGTKHLLLVSMISTSTSSPRSPLIEAETKPKFSWGIQTSRFWVHSACVVGSLKAFLSTTKYLKSGSFRSNRESPSAILKLVTTRAASQWNAGHRLLQRGKNNLLKQLTCNRILT